MELFFIYLMLCVNWTFQVINGRKQKSILEGMLRNDTVLWKVGILIVLVMILIFILMTILISDERPEHRRPATAAG